LCRAVAEAAEKLNTSAGHERRKQMTPFNSRVIFLT